MTVPYGSISRNNQQDATL